MERIYVAVRARPLSLDEAKSSPWRISGNSISNPNYSSIFDFDRIFGEDVKTREVYETRTKDIVEAAVHGFNGTVFAYGQTNSGKTHTMRGSTSEPGVIPLSIRDLFDILKQDMDREFLLRMSYMEIYNEEINDLLAPEHRKLQIHESIERGIYVAGLKEEIVASPEQVLEFMEFGESHRHIGETNMNLYSSRSHTIFRMIIESRERSENEDASSSCDAVRVSVLNLVDLAGSERAAKTGAEGVRLKEGSHINKSLMTLGTVIKKLSEGAESQGGHVPYRDSKLTRILQPALGGNANTAIICNITLASIHADETKSSLQFASRALRVTNCAHVNEILTDGALLKRQKKEIQELKAKLLKGSDSEHFGEEVLNLRNTLLQTELEKERIALELEEEKKAQAERERRLQEQAKKIANLSSIVLNSNRDDNIQQPKKDKRRDTWCFTKQPRETLTELNTAIQAKAPGVKSLRSKHEVGPLIPFQELVNKVDMGNLLETVHIRNSNAVVECKLPPPPLLLVTSRKKTGRNKGLLEENNELKELRAAYENLLLKFETERTENEIKVNTLSRKLAQAESCLNNNAEETKTSSDSDAILVIKQLQEKISTLEMEKYSSDKNLDCVVELAKEQNLCAMHTYDQLNEELLNAREEVRIAHDQLSAAECLGISSIELLSDVRDLTSEIQNSRDLSESMGLIVDDYSQSFLSVSNYLSEFKHLASENSLQLISISSDHEKLHNGLRHKICELENEKRLLQNQCLDLHGRVQEQSLLLQNSEKELTELSEGHDFEKTELFSRIQTLEKENSSLSSSFLAREKENLRKDLEKTKTKLKETESKLKNAIQEKTKLEGEKACSERELKKLQGQKALLQRDISKCESLAGRRRDSMVDRSSNVFDQRKGKALSHSFDQIQEEYRRLEVLAFEMETTIDSLESQLASANEEKEFAVSSNENLVSKLQALSDELNMSRSELEMLQEENSHLSLNLEESKSYNHKMEDSIKLMLEGKDELEMQLTEALLAMEEEKAIWAAKEKASIETIDVKSRKNSSENTLLLKEIKEVEDQLTSYREDCEVLKKKLALSEDNSQREQELSKEKYLKYEKLISDLRVSEDQSKRSQEKLSSDYQLACEHIEKIKMELNMLNKEKELLLNETRESSQTLENQILMVTTERDALQSQIKKHRVDQLTMESSNLSEELLKANAEIECLTCRLSKLEVKTHDNEVIHSKERAKLRMMLRGTNAKMEAFSVRYKEAVQENNLMDAKFREASAKLKTQLAQYVQETFNLKKQLVAVKTQ